MRLADDDRGRVPFALIGVLLLVASAMTAVSLARSDIAPTRTRTDRAVERAKTEISLAVASAARTALRAAARHPVVEPANTRFGSALSADHPFRDALKLRIYANAERALRHVTTTVGSVHVTVSLPRIQSTDDAEHAIDRVTVLQVDSTDIRVTIDGVCLTLHRAGHVLMRSTRNVSVIVESATLALKKRVARFEELLSRDALSGPGFDRRLTFYLHEIVWIRGMGQYLGLPIENVLANRHVALMTNRALLSVQRMAFGQADVTAITAYRRARVRVGFTDVLTAAKIGVTNRAGNYLDRQNKPGDFARVGIPTAATTMSEIGKIADERLSVPFGVGVTADRMFIEFVDGDGQYSLSGTLDAAFTTIARRAVEVEHIRTRTTLSGHAPRNWSLVSATNDHSIRIVESLPSATPLPGEFRRVARFGRRVVVTDKTTRLYRNGTREKSVVKTTRETFRVTIAVGYRINPPPRVPVSDNPEFVLSSPIDGVNPWLHTQIETKARHRLLEKLGGVDAVARRIIEGEQLLSAVRIRVEIPDSIRKRALIAVATLRDKARNITENVSIAAFANGHLPVDELQNRVRGLYNAPESYDTATARALAAVRTLYLTHVSTQIARRRSTRILSDIGTALGERGVKNVPRISPTTSDSGVVAAVDGSPSYLTLTEVGPATDPDIDAAYYPLAAQNVNWFTIPYGDAVEAVLDGVFGTPEETVDLGRAAQALFAANQMLTLVDNETLRNRRNRLRAAVAESVHRAASIYRNVLYMSDIPFSEAERRTITRRAFEQWPTLTARAKAIANGSIARAIASEATIVADTTTASQLDVLATRLRANAPRASALSSVEVDVGLIRVVSQSVRSSGRNIAQTALTEASDVALDRLSQRLALNAIPVGLPLVPAPGFWYATFNGWTVSVRGSWAKFVVRARGGSPVGPGHGLAFVREDAPVTFDVNGDGQPDFIGWNKRISFEVKAVVVIVVPPGPQGVGDMGGQRTESSPGWKFDHSSRSLKRRLLEH